MAGGAFADLSAYLKEDSDYSEEQYQPLIMKGGQYQGKQYILPFFYEAVFLVSEESTLKYEGFSVENCGTLQGFLNEINSYLDKQDATPFLGRGQVNRPILLPVCILYDAINYDEQTYHLPEETEAFAKLQKRFFNMPLGMTKDSTIDIVPDPDEAQRLLASHEALFIHVGYNTGTLMPEYCNAIGMKGKTVLLPLRDRNGNNCRGCVFGSYYEQM